MFVPFIRWQCFCCDKFGETLDPGGRRSGSGMMGMFDRKLLGPVVLLFPFAGHEFRIHSTKFARK